MLGENDHLGGVTVTNVYFDKFLNYVCDVYLTRKLQRQSFYSFRRGLRPTLFTGPILLASGMKATLPH